MITTQLKDGTHLVTNIKGANMCARHLRCNVPLGLGNRGNQKVDKINFSR